MESIFNFHFFIPKKKVFPCLMYVSQRLKESTPEERPDRVTLEKAYTLMKKTAKFLASCLEKAENQARLFTVNARIKKVNTIFVFLYE
jgi:hypothetical protein